MSVAAQSGVSKQTVSNVLNSPHLVAAETAQKVREAIDALGYRPHRAAQQLRTRRSRVLALRAEQELSNKVFDRFLHALTEAAAAREYRIMLYVAADDDAEVAAYDELLDRWDIDGIVLTATHPGDQRTAYLARAGVPCVTFGRPWDGSGHHPWVDVDGAAGTRAATEELIADGHRRIAYLNSEPHTAPPWSDLPFGLSRDRRSGWEKALKQAGVPILEPVTCDSDIAAARLATHQLLDELEPTAMVCDSDTVALGALVEITGRGLRPGIDVAVVGFDNSEICEVLGLSSVAQPLVEAAHHCVRMLVDVIESTETIRPAGEQILLPPTFVRRATSGPQQSQANSGPHQSRAHGPHQSRATSGRDQPGVTNGPHQLRAGAAAGPRASTAGPGEFVAEAPVRLI